MERWVKNDTENYIYYYYDESGVCGMCYNGSEYYYRKNIFGDVIEIYNNLGVLQCKYVYDAWGNHKVYGASGVELSTSSTNIGNINPIRYRSYYWDKEFNLYYLQSRYYDPALGRFISADAIDYLDPEDVAGLNLYAYGLNNPVMYMDPTGHFVISLGLALLIGFAVGAAVGFGATVYTDYKDDGEVFNGDVSAGEYITNTLIGGAIGTSSAGAIYAAPYIGTAIGSSFGASSFATATGGTVALGLTVGQIAALSVGAIGVGLVFMGNPTTPNPNDPSRPHKGTRNGKSGWNRHSGKRSGGPEKKDSRMKYRKRKRGMKGFYWFFPFYRWLEELLESE